ncbi:MAG: glycosyl transferase family 39 [Desulfurococcaceae archaeon]
MKKTYINVLLILIVIAVASYFLIYTAWGLYENEIKRGGRGYVTDEVWYVSAARNILVKIFGIQPKQGEIHGATVVFASKPTDYYSLAKLAGELNVSLRTDYTKLPAIYVNGPRDRVFEFLNIVRINYSVTDIVPGWQLPDNEGVNNYINWEHPPLGKYLFALSMLLAGDLPIYWRLPIIISGILASVLVFVVLKHICQSEVIALAGSLVFIADTISRAIFSIAILDGYVALFTLLGLYFIIKERYREALIVGVIAGLFKATGLFITIPVLILLARRITKFINGNLFDFIYYLIAYGLLTAILYIALLTIASFPIINFMGFSNWFRYALLGSIEWHLSAKCTTQGCPISSAPWDWFIGYNSFPLYIYPDGKTLSAEGFYPLWFTSLVLTVLSTPIIYKKYGKYGHSIVYFLGVLSGYIVIWILGSRTQYSFYAIQLAPLVYVNLFSILHLTINNTSVQLEVLRSWRSIVNRVIDLLEKLLLLKS